MPLDIPVAVRNKANLVGAGQWIADLPLLVADLEREWSITVGRAFPDATEALVCTAVTSQGRPVVLKLITPREGDAALNEITFLRLTNGDGCVRMIRADVARGAMLLEALGRSVSELGLPEPRRHAILCDVASKVWRVAPDCGLPTGADKARWQMTFIEDTWVDLGRPCSRHAIDHALECASRRAAAHSSDRAVLVHGDVHQWNTLESGHSFTLIDPDGLLAEPEYDLGIIMREDPESLMTGDPHERARWLARRSGRNEVAIWEWGVVERVSTGLTLMAIAHQLGQDMLAAAARIAAEWD